ncbi:MAG: DUF6431 domain-containing protein [Turicibacter sp.]
MPTYLMGIFHFKHMIIIDDFTLVHSKNKNNESLIYVSNSVEHPLCPYCQLPMKIVGNTKRVWWSGDSLCRKLVVRKLRCSHCCIGHHELPNFLVPYKRYDAHTIQLVLTSSITDCDQSVSDSTIYRWKASFTNLIPYFLNALLSLATRFNLQGESLMTPSRISSFSPFSKLLPTSDNWLASLVKTLVNASLWKKPCSACAGS